MEDNSRRLNSAVNGKSTNLSNTFTPKRKLPSEMNRSRIPPNFPSGSRFLQVDLKFPGGTKKNPNYEKQFL